MELRTALAAVIVLGCGLSGKAMARASGRRYAMLKELAEGMRMLRIQIVRAHEQLERALRLAGGEIFSGVADGLSEGMGVLEAWERTSSVMFARGGQADCLTERDKGVLEGLFLRLGHIGSAAQDEAIATCVAGIEMLRDEAGERAASAGRTHVTIGFLVGLAIAVLIV